jgi:hypothetical protein
MSETPPCATSVKVIKGLAFLGGLYLFWSFFDDRMSRLEEQVSVLENEVEVLAPLSKVMSGYRPKAEAKRSDYTSLQATGPANVAEANTDSPLAWCPSSQDAGSEWLELHFGEPVVAQEIRIHANFNPGAVVQVLGGSVEGELHELWSGEGVADDLHSIFLEASTTLLHLKLVLDTAKIPGWNEIDAVALLDENGAEHWATKARASSTWGN